MHALLKVNDFINKRAPVLKDVLRLVIPRQMRSRFAQRKFALTIEGQDYVETFANIHQKNWWGNPESVSGYGSEMQRTESIRTELPVWLSNNAIDRIFDAPCGDFNWMKSVVDQVGMSYIGGDIVPALISENSARYADGARVQFSVFDILKDSLPDVRFWLCRDVLFHFPNDSIAQLLERFAQSNVEFIATSHFTDVVSHPDIKFGEYRPVNLCKPPFNWPEPIHLIYDGAEGHASQRYLAIWRNPSFNTSRPTDA